MRRVLVLTYHFPPEGGPAVQRVLKFVKYLPFFGYEPIVLTALHPIGVKDQDLFNEIPSSLRVYRVMDFGAWVPYELRKRLFHNLLPDRHITWKRFAFSKAIQIIQKEKIDLLFSSSPPHSVQVIAKEIAMQTGLPWVADLRDEWTRHPNFQAKSERAIFLERETLSFSKTITVVTQAAQQNFKEIVQERVPVYFLPNGYDPEDFVGIQSTQKSHQNSRLNFVYCGRFTKTSSPHAFFLVLREMVKEDPSWKAHLRIQVIGGTNNQNAMSSFPELNSIMEWIPYQPHRKALAFMRSADVLLLFSTGGPGSEILTGKVYEYMATGKPILCVVSHEGELSQMLMEYRNAYIGILTQENPPIATVRKLLQAWKEGKLERPIQKEWIQQFDRKKQTGELAKIFDRVLGV